MTSTPDLDEVAAKLVGMSVEVADQLLREVGTCTPPQMHMLDSGFQPNYLGSCTSRSFYRGEDAAHAVAEMGVLASGLLVERIVLTWENADLSTALELDGEFFDTAQVVVEADENGHLVTWCPFDVEIGPQSIATGMPTILPTWRELSRVRNGPLPSPVLGLIEAWRRFDPHVDVSDLFSRFEAEGYLIRMTEGLRRV